MEHSAAARNGTAGNATRLAVPVSPSPTASRAERPHPLVDPLHDAEGDVLGAMAGLDAEDLLHERVDHEVALERGAELALLALELDLDSKNEQGASREDKEVDALRIKVAVMLGMDIARDPALFLEELESPLEFGFRIERAIIRLRGFVHAAVLPGGMIKMSGPSIRNQAPPVKHPAACNDSA